MQTFYVQDNYANARKVYGGTSYGVTWLPNNKKHHIDTYTSYYNVYYFSTEEKAITFDNFLYNLYKNNCNIDKKDLKKAIKNWLRI